MITQEARNYVAQQRAAGIPDETIKSNLKTSGWTDADINEIFPPPAAPVAPPPAPVTAPPASPTPAPTSAAVSSTSHTGMYIAAAVIVLLLLAGGAAFAMPQVREMFFPTAVPTDDLITPEPLPPQPGSTTSTSPTNTTPTSYASACATLFPGGVANQTATPLALKAGDTDATTGGKVSAVQYILKADSSSLMVTGTFDTDTTQAVSKMETDFSKEPKNKLTDTKTGKVLTPDPTGQLGPYGYTLIGLSCSLIEAAAKQSTGTQN